MLFVKYCIEFVEKGKFQAGFHSAYCSTSINAAFKYNGLQRAARLAFNETTLVIVYLFIFF